MIDFFSFIGLRALSGVMNGLFYVGSAWAWPITIILACLTGLVLFRRLRKGWKGMKQWQKVLGVLGAILSVISVVLVGMSFVPGFKFAEVHFWTFASQTCLAATDLVSSSNIWSNIWWLALAVSPSAFLQKLFINLTTGASWSFRGTDAASGTTWGMTLFDKRVNVPRLANMKVKLVIALVCVALFLVVQHRKSQRLVVEDIYVGA